MSPLSHSELERNLHFLCGGSKTFALVDLVHDRMESIPELVIHLGGACKADERHDQVSGNVSPDVALLRAKVDPDENSSKVAYVINDRTTEITLVGVSETRMIRDHGHFAVIFISAVPEVRHDGMCAYPAVCYHLRRFGAEAGDIEVLVAEYPSGISNPPEVVLARHSSHRGDVWAWPALHAVAADLQDRNRHDRRLIDPVDPEHLAGAIEEVNPKIAIAHEPISLVEGKL